MVNCNNLYIFELKLIFMSLERIEFDNGDGGRKKAIENHLGRTVLLKDSDEGFLLGEIDSLKDDYGYKLLENSSSLKRAERNLIYLLYKDLEDLYVINKTTNERT